MPPAAAVWHIAGTRSQRMGLHRVPSLVMTSPHTCSSQRVYHKEDAHLPHQTTPPTPAQHLSHPTYRCSSQRMHYKCTHGLYAGATLPIATCIQHLSHPRHRLQWSPSHFLHPTIHKRLQHCSILFLRPLSRPQPQCHSRALCSLKGGTWCASAANNPVYIRSQPAVAQSVCAMPAVMSTPAVPSLHRLCGFACG